MHSSPSFLFVFVSFLLQLSCHAAQSDESFTVVAYNLENVFDVDGVALFEDYKQDDLEDPFVYTRRKLLTKLENAAAVLKAVNEGAGPEVLLIQELEGDFTPDSAVTDFDAFLEAHASTTVASMLTDGWDPDYAGLPAVAWLHKALADYGLECYEVVVAPSKAMDSRIAHVNAVFSKFPIKSVAVHPLLEARDILEVELEVEGHRLWLYDNHWKSGASNPKREPVRLQNADVLRSLIDQRLEEDPAAEIIIGGDLNSHYNQSLLFPKIETGINDVLGSQGDESFQGGDLYNLWFELPPEARFSEVWRGRRGSLMHLILSGGLYDSEGISYVDGSFAKLVVPGLNVDAIGRPLAWNPAGTTGGGFTDHIPVMAEFRLGAFRAAGPLSKGDDALDYEMPLSLADFPELSQFPDGAFIGEIEDAELGPYVDRLYEVEAAVLGIKPLRLKVGEAVWPAYTYDKNLFKESALPAYLNEGKLAKLVVRIHIYRGKKQLIVEKIL
ncbi:MAG: hypothetical protein AAGC73_04765 [Verrucomicrobiota bacterium]